MNIELLRKYIGDYLAKRAQHPEAVRADLQQRHERMVYYQSWTADRLQSMTEEQLAEYFAKQWAMQIWGNKQYVVDKLLHRHGLAKIREALARLVWGKEPVDRRWDSFRQTIKGIGPAMMSEILCHVHPDECVLWNRRVRVALRHLGVEGLPQYDYQLNGKKYIELCEVAKRIVAEMRAMGDPGADLMTADYFFWDELQVEDNLSQIHKPEMTASAEPSVDRVDAATLAFIHDEVRDKIADIGRWLGLQTETEKKVAEGAVVDAVWHATIGNMGRVIYVFEVQTKGSIDSLVLNLLRSLNNPAVQGVVAVSDSDQLQKIHKETEGVTGLHGKLKCWDYRQVLEVHEALESVSAAINSLGLVPQGF